MTTPANVRGYPLSAGTRPVRSAQMVVTNEELRAELLRRVAADEKARHALDSAAMAAADGENLPWLRQVIADVGWPGKSLVGEDGAQAAWLLAQHADRDPAFQRQCLDLLTAAAASAVRPPSCSRPISPTGSCCTRTRRRSTARRPSPREGRFEPRKLRDPDHVDQRGLAFCLGPRPGTLPGWPRITYRSRCGCRARPARRRSRPGCWTRARPAPRPAQGAARGASPSTARAERMTP